MEPLPKPAQSATKKEKETYEEKVRVQRHFKKYFKKVIMHLSVIVDIINSDRFVRVQLYEKLCTNTALYVRKHFPWIEFSPTVHQILGHSAQLIEENGGRGLLAFSEEGSEAIHHVVKEVRGKETRKMNVFVNILDTMNKIWFRTDPGQRAFDKVIKCSICFKFGHSCR